MYQRYHKEINMAKKDIILARLSELLLELKKKYNVKEIGLFGSLVRDEYKSGSDADFPVGFEKGLALFDLTSLEFFLKTGSGQKWILSSNMP